MKKIVALFAFSALLVFGIAWKAKTKEVEKLQPVKVKAGNALGVPYTMSSTTNSSGIITVTYQNPYTVTPNIQAQIFNQTATGRQQIRIYNNTPAGFTCSVFQQNSVIPALLGIEILLAATTPVNAADVDFLITAKQ